MQRIVRWNVGMSDLNWELPGKKRIDLDYGHVGYFDLTAENLGKISPELRTALTRNGKIGRIVNQTYSIEGGSRIFTFLVAFD